MPYTGASYSEPDNTDRAGWAQAAVHTYAEQTRKGAQEQTIDGETEEDREHAEEVISDLLGDLRHLCKQFGLDFDNLSERGAMHFRDEVAEEAGAMEVSAGIDELVDYSKKLRGTTSDEITDLLTPDPWGQAGGK